IQAQTLTIPASEVPVFALAPVGQRVAPPAPGAPVSATIPPIASRTLPNGLKVFVASSHRLPLISADLRIASGGSADPAGRAGLADMTANLVNKGTTTRSATEIARQTESLGAAIEAAGGVDSSDISLETRSDREDQAFTLYADIVRNPIFAAEE